MRVFTMEVNKLEYEGTLIYLLFLLVLAHKINVFLVEPESV